MQITENQAICMLFYKSYTQDNLKHCRERLNKLGKDFVVCYLNNNSGQPLLVSKQRIVGDSFNYQIYPNTFTPFATQRSEIETDQRKEDDDDDDEETSEEESTEDEEDTAEARSEPKIVLDRHYTLLKFCNLVFATSKPSCLELYHPQSSYTVADILPVLKKYTNLFDNATPLSFISWCSINEPNLYKRGHATFTDKDRAALPPLTTQTKLTLFKMKEEHLYESARMLM